MGVTSFELPDMRFQNSTAQQTFHNPAAKKSDQKTSKKNPKTKHSSSLSEQISAEP